MDATPPSKRLKDGELLFSAKKSAGGVTSTVEVGMVASATVGDLAARLGEHEGCDGSLITIVCHGAVLKPANALQDIANKQGAEGKVAVVYIVRKPAGQAAEPAAKAGPPPQPAAAAPPADAVAKAAAGAPPPGASSASSGSQGGQAAPPGTTAERPKPGVATTDGSGQRVVLMLRHGQCCHDGEGDEMKGLTAHGNLQGEDSARYIIDLFSAGKLPEQRALLHSTSRRARETAKKLSQMVPGLQVWNADLLRETDPTSNPLRAEEVFMRLFDAPPVGAADTLIIVAHNNIILYLLMRAAGVPIERAAQSWRLFHLRHASVTRVDIASTGAKQVVLVGAAGHISPAAVTWSNVVGADMSAWKGGKPERHKFSGRMLVLVRQVYMTSAHAQQQIGAVAAHIKGLSEYMMSSHLTVTCTEAAQQTGAAIAQQFSAKLRLFPNSIQEQPEAAFLQFFCGPPEHSRDAVVMVAEDSCVLYWLLRALQMNAAEAKAASALYRIGNASVTLVNIKSDGSTKIVAVGDTGHIPLDCT